MSATLVSDVGPYCIAPAWVLNSGVSDRAFRLYCYLGLRFNRDKGCAWPSRRRIADDLGCSPKTVDRAVTELVEVGAIEVRKRKTAGGDWDSNLYIVRVADPQGVASDMTLLDTDDHMVVTDVQGGSVTDDATGSVKNVPYINNYLEPEEERERTIAPASRERPRDHIFDAVVAVTGTNLPDITKLSRGPLNVAVSQLKQAGATADEIHRRSRNYHARYPDAALTPTALAKHWPQLAAAPPPTRPKDRFADMAQRLAGEVTDGPGTQGIDPVGRGLPAG